MDKSGSPVRLTASMVMYGNAEKTHESIVSVCNYVKSEGFTLFLIDNASPDGALEAVKSMGLPDNVQCIALEKNIGFGKGHNTVIPRLNSSYHCVINPDIKLDRDAVSQMADWMDNKPDVVMTGPKLLFPTGEEQKLAKRRPAFLPLVARQTNFPFLKKYESHYLMEDADLGKATDVEFLSGSFFLIRTDIYKKIGGFDEKYFMYVEDADITMKAKQEGRTVYLPQVEVYHEWQREARRNPKKFFWQLKSMFRYFAKWGFKLK